MAYPPRGFTSSSSVSTETPPKLVPSFDHFVTQWMSHGIVSNGSAWNSSHVHSRSLPTMPSTRKPQASVSTRGVGPAVSTGKPRSTYCPGGTRSASSSGVLRRRLKPRDTKSFIVRTVGLSEVRSRPSYDLVIGLHTPGHHRDHRTAA